MFVEAIVFVLNSIHDCWNNILSNINSFKSNISFCFDVVPRTISCNYEIWYSTIQNQIPISCSFEGNNSEVSLNRFEIYHNWEMYRWTRTNLKIFLNSTHFSTHSCWYSVIYNIFLLNCVLYTMFLFWLKKEFSFSLNFPYYSSL